MIREFRREDAAGIAAVLRAVDETHVVTPEVVLFRHRSTPAKANSKVWVAAEGDGIVGYARARRPWDTSDATVGEFEIAVVPASRKRGIGADLYERSISHLRAVGAAHRWVVGAAGRHRVPGAARPRAAAVVTQVGARAA